jgi:hypothetical protein
VATYAAGARFGARVGVASAVLTAASSVFLSQVTVPTTNGLVGSLWMLAVACATGTKPLHMLASGLAAGAAIAVQPYLFPLGLGVVIFLMFRPERLPHQRMRAVVTCVAGTAAGWVALAMVRIEPLLLNQIEPRLGQLSRWPVAADLAFIALAVMALFLLPGTLTMLYLGLFTVNVALYVLNVEREQWLLAGVPTLPLVIILAVGSIDAMWRRWR